MDASFERRFAAWLDLTAHLIRAHPARGQLPTRMLLDQFLRTWDDPVAFNSVNADGTADVEFIGPVSGEAPAEWRWFCTHGSGYHPLIQWFARTQDWSAFTLGRVPDRTCEGPGYSRFLELARVMGVEQQLAVPCRMSQGGSWAFVLGRSGPDYTDAELELARRIQSLLFLLARQASVEVPESTARLGAAHGLTAREQAVLALLADGLTAAGIAHRLGISPRTATKHLEHIYRKLGVNDRLLAVRAVTSRGSSHDAHSPE